MNEKKASLNSSFLDEVKDADPEVVYDLLVLGGGPAAMSAVIYAARKMLRLAIITLDFGGQVRETSEVENWLGFQAINAMDLADMFEEHVKSFDISVSLAVSATKVLKEGDVFKVQSDDGNTYSGKALGKKNWWAEAWPIVLPVTRRCSVERRSSSLVVETRRSPRLRTF
jgi:alkyl hydroperoxide reductase subunit F